MVQLSKNLFFSLFVIVFIPTIIAILLSSIYSYNNRVNEIKNNLNRVSQNVNTDIQTYLNNVNQDAYAITQSSVIHDLVSDSVITNEDILNSRKTFQNSFDYITLLYSLAIYDTNGTKITKYYNNIELENIKKDEENLDVKSVGSQGIFSSFYNISNEYYSGLVFDYTLPITYQSIVYGYVKLTLKADFLKNLLDSISSDEFTHFVLVDSKENVICSNANKTLTLSEYNSSFKCNIILTDTFKKPGSNSNIYDDRHGLNYKTLIYNTVPNTYIVGNKDYWTFVCVSDTSSIISKTFSGIAESYVLVAVLILIALVTAFVFNFQKWSDLDKICDTLKQFTRGAVPPKLVVNNRGDIKELADNINLISADAMENYKLISQINEMTKNVVFEYNMPEDRVRVFGNFNKYFGFRPKSESFKDSFLCADSNCVIASQKHEFAEFFDKAFAGESLSKEFNFETIYKDYAWWRIQSMPIVEDDKIVKVLFVMVNTDRIKKREANLRRLAEYDQLTQIYNRKTFEVTLTNEIDVFTMRNHKTSVMFIDIDDFKHYNDDYSHAVGDEILVFVAKTITELVKKHGFCGRYGGDEFVICFREDQNVKSDTLARTIISKFSAGFDSSIVNHHFKVNCSIGINYLVEGKSDIYSIMKCADEAMYSIKKKQKNGFAFYNDYNDL